MAIHSNYPLPNLLRNVTSLYKHTKNPEDYDTIQSRMVNVLTLIRRGVDRLRRWIKIMKADGSVMKLRTPLSVKEILINCPNHGIFEAEAFGGLGISHLPLPERTGLLGGHLYYLIPLPLSHHDFFNFKDNNSIGHLVRASSCVRQPSSAGTATDLIRKQEKADDHIVNKINRGDVSIISSSYSTHRSTVRVKLRLRKEELASFLSAMNVNIVMESDMVAASIQDASRQYSWQPRARLNSKIYFGGS